MAFTEELYVCFARIFNRGSAPRRIYGAAFHIWNGWMLRRFIKNKRVLVVGSGPSAKEIPPIPSDVLAFACNLSPNYLPVVNGKRHVDLYMLNKKAYIIYGDTIKELLPTLDINIFATRNLIFMRSLQTFSWQRFVQDRFSGTSDYGYQRLTGKKLPTGIKESTDRGTPSTGISLVLYALLYGAKEVYIAGLDLAGEKTPMSNWGIYREGKHPHKSIDEEIVHYIAAHKRNVFTTTQGSLLSGHFPYRSLL